MSFNFNKSVPGLTFWLTVVVLASGIVWVAAKAYGQSENDHADIQSVKAVLQTKSSSDAVMARNIARICQKLDIPCEVPKD